MLSRTFVQFTGVGTFATAIAGFQGAHVRIAVAAGAFCLEDFNCAEAGRCVALELVNAVVGGFGAANCGTQIRFAGAGLAVGLTDASQLTGRTIDRVYIDTTLFRLTSTF